MNAVMNRWLQQPWWVIVLPLLLIKLALAWALPMTGDEAYFVLWGRHLDYGYYDHPPMAGWMMWLQLQVGDHRAWLRFPGLVTELIIAAAFYGLMRPLDAVKARWLALLLLISPMSLLNVFTLTDTGCILFAALSFVAAAQGLLRQQLRWAVLAGLGLGLAFLSKYFAVLLGVGYLLFYFAIARRYWRQGVVLVLAALPFGLLNLHWNLNHCWTNLLFNLVNRTEGEDGWQWAAMASYGVMMLYVLLPPVLAGLWFLRRGAEPVAEPVARVLQLALVLSLTALVGFLLVSTGKNIGLHWVLWFHPFLLLLLWRLPVPRWQQVNRQVAWYSAAHVLVLGIVLALPLSAWESRPKLQRDILAAYEGASILALARTEATRRLPADEALVLATQSYVASSVLSYLAREAVMVLGTGSKYARQDDFLTDFRTLDGASVLLFLKRPREAETARPWFAEVDTFSVRYRGQDFDFVLGRGFDYATYREQVLREIIERYYRFPDWLPVWQCEVVDRYAAAAGTAGWPGR